MSLFIDHDLITIDDLAGVDHNILSIAAVEGIDLTKKIFLSHQLLTQEVSCALARESTDDVAFSINQVVATPTLRLCHAMKALELGYQEAFASQGFDRYERCRASYASDARKILLAELEQGLGICDEPLQQPNGPTVSISAGVGPAGTLEFAVSWVNQRGQESSIGASTVVDNDQGQALTVVPPVAPEHATGWLVYANFPGDRPGRQSGPLSMHQSWTTSLGQLSSLGVNEGGQTGDTVLRLSPSLNRLRRG